MFMTIMLLWSYKPDLAISFPGVFFVTVQEKHPLKDTYPHDRTR